MFLHPCKAALAGFQVSGHFAQAMREGSIQRLDSCIREHQFQFIQAGTFLLLEKLKLYVHRRLFKRMALLHREQEPTKAERLPLGEHSPSLHYAQAFFLIFKMSKVRAMSGRHCALRFLSGSKASSVRQLSH